MDGAVGRRVRWASERQDHRAIPKIIDAEVTGRLESSALRIGAAIPTVAGYQLNGLIALQLTVLAPPWHVWQ